MSAVDASALDGGDPVERDRYGRYLITDEKTGKPVPFTRATTIASTLSDKFGLQQWAQRMTAVGLTARKDLYARVAATDPADKQALNRLVGEAKEAAAASAGANLGTALHAFTERLDRGEAVSPPEPWDKDLDTYRATLAAANVAIVDGMIEQVVCLPSIGVAGTFDRLVTIAGYDLPLVADLKTGGYLDWCEISIQLALYAHAETIFDPRTKKHTPMPTVDQTQALVIHLPVGKAECTLWLVDIVAGWEAVQQAVWVRGWRKSKGLASVLPAEAPAAVLVPAAPSVAPGDRRGWLAGRVARLRDDHPEALVSLGGLWPEGVATFKASEDHTDAELDLIEAALAAVEAKHQVPFPEPMPEPIKSRPIPETVERPVPPPMAERAELDDLIATLKKLSVDRLAVAEAAGKLIEIPNLRTNRVPVELFRALRAVTEMIEDTSLFHAALKSAGPNPSDVAAVFLGVDRGELHAHAVDDDGWLFKPAA